MRTNPPIDFAAIDPQARYREFNRKYFGGKLPADLPITLKPLKGRSGSCKFTLAAIAPHTIATLQEVNRYRPVDANMGRVTLKGIDLSSLMRYDEGDFDGILLHEMVHAYLAITGWPFETHGREFLEEARHVQAESGVRIPLTHDTSGAEVSKAKRTGVTLFERGPDQVYYLFDPRALEAFTEKVKSDSVMFDRARVMVVTSGVWARSTVKKKPEKYGTRYWKLTPDVARDIAGAEVVAEFDGKRVRAELIAAERAERGARASANPRKSDLLAKILELRAEIARRAQAVYDAWEQDGDGYDEEFGGGGICDRVADEIASVLSEADIDTVAGGQDGDDHAFVLAIDDRSAYSVDIPPGVDERGGGYSWKKIPGVTITEDDVAVDEVRHSDVAGGVEENPSKANKSGWISWENWPDVEAAVGSLRGFLEHGDEGDEEAVRAALGGAGPVAEISVVEANRRGRGHGSKLVAHAEREATKSGATHVVLFASTLDDADDHPSAFWEAVGYERVTGEEGGDGVFVKLLDGEARENPPRSLRSAVADVVARETTYAQVHDAVRERLRKVGAEPRWLTDFVSHRCPQADREHAESERQHCHVGHLPGKVCYASAADGLPLAHKLGLVLHEFGHLVLQGKDMRRPWKWNEQDASDAGGNLVGLQVPFRGRLTLEWARPPRWLLDKLGGRE